MKRLLVLSLTVFIVPIFAHQLQALLDDKDGPIKVHELYEKHYSSYKQYLKRYNKQHDMTVAEPIRLLRYAKAVKLIESHNKRYEMGLESYQLGLNEMSDWTEEEKQKLHGFKPSKTHKRNVTYKFSQKTLEPLPKSVDYRKKGVVGPVKNQNPCGTCYIFAALSAVESYIAMKTRKPVVPLSEQNVMDCSGLEGCDGRGGSAEQVWKWMADNGGVMAEAEYPYRKGDYPSCLFKREKAKATVTGYAVLPENDELGLKQALALYGPVSVALHASLPTFYEYNTGIYADPNCPRDVNHAVLAIGYGEENGKEYYIIRNSWGESWGDKGYAKILAGNFQCGIGIQNEIPLL